MEGRTTGQTGEQADDGMLLIVRAASVVSAGYVSFTYTEAIVMCRIGIAVEMSIVFHIYRFALIAHYRPTERMRINACTRKVCLFANSYAGSLHYSCLLEIRSEASGRICVELNALWNSLQTLH